MQGTSVMWSHKQNLWDHERNPFMPTCQYLGSLCIAYTAQPIHWSFRMRYPAILLIPGRLPAQDSRCLHIHTPSQPHAQTMAIGIMHAAMPVLHC